MTVFDEDPLRQRVWCSPLLLTFGLAFVSTLSGCAERPAHQNFVLVMADDLGWGDVHYNGNELLQTPSIDEMSRSGLRFDRFYTAPTCSQTRASVLTGRNSRRFGVDSANVGHLTASEATLAEILRAKGYATGFFGKWHLGALTPDERDGHRGGSPDHYSAPWQHGFDVTFATEARVPTFNPVGWQGDSRIGRSSYWIGEARRATATDDMRGDDSRILMNRVIPFIRNAVEAGDPFFAVVWFHAPHEPVRADPHDTSYAHIDDPVKRAYYTVVSAMDGQIGRLRSELRALDIERNTLLVFNSDNGPAVGVGSAGKLRGTKSTLLEGGIRVPAVMEWPGHIKPRISKVPASTDDLFPTILDLAGIEAPRGRPIDGVSLRSVIEGTSAERQKPIGFWLRGDQAWIEGRFKLVVSNRGRRIGLFDVVADPRERRNLSGVERARVGEMRSALDSWRKSVRASRIGTDMLERTRREKTTNTTRSSDVSPLPQSRP